MKNLKRAFASLSTAALMSFSSPASASGIPTFDAAAIAQIVQQIVTLGKIEGINVDQLKRLADQIILLNDQIVLAERHLDSITGAREAIAELLRGDLTADKISTTLTALRRVQGVPDRISEQFTLLDHTFEFIDGDTLYPNAADAARSEVYDMRLSSVKSEIVVSEKIFEDAGTAFEHYDTFQTQLGSDESNEDLKAAIDLNTRVQIENGQNIAKMLQLLAVSAQSKSISDAQDIADDAINNRLFRVEKAEIGDNQ